MLRVRLITRRTCVGAASSRCARILLRPLPQGPRSFRPENRHGLPRACSGSLPRPRITYRTMNLSVEDFNPMMDPDADDADANNENALTDDHEGAGGAGFKGPLPSLDGRDD
eukprot:SAG11_NODE_3518_length_2396_cov_3.103178_3_plen_112_part_00